MTGLERVINYDFPYTIEDYVHRIGRTGRAGLPGQAISFFTGHDAGHSHELVRILKEAGQPIPKQLAKFAAQPKKLTSRERWKKNKQKFKRKGSNNQRSTGSKKKKRDIGCFGCGEKGHQKAQCPLRSKAKRPSKAATST